VAFEARLINAERYAWVQARARSIRDEIHMLESTGIASDLRRPTTAFADIASRRPAGLPLPDKALQSEVECRLKYAGYIARQEREIASIKALEGCEIPADLDIETIASLSREIREKLVRVRPTTLGQAARIPGVTPAAVSILAVFLKRRCSSEAGISSAGRR
jgi:tRNA uridine 5-carboxymethylaminomethyl modification enzyme